MNPSDESADSLTAETAFDLLADENRRRALTGLRESDGEMALHDLAEEVVARREDLPRAAVTPDARERAAAMLHHSHLPRLADAGVVAYDHAAGRVELTDFAEELDPYFDLPHGFDSS